jgi:phage terminase small subunit
MATATKKKPEAKAYDGSTPLDNAQHEQLCHEYLIDFNGKEAGIRAGYSARSAKQQVSELLTKPNLAARLAYLAQEKKNAAKKTAADIRERIENIAFTDLTDLVTFNESGATFIKPSNEIDPKHAAAIESIGFKEDNVGVSFKLKKINPMKALELLGKEEGMFTEKVEVTGDEGFANILAAALNRAEKAKGEK